MSKIGKKIITIPEGVEVKMDGKKVVVKGPKGELSYVTLDGVNVKIDDTTITVTVDTPNYSNLRGLTRTLIANMIEGVVNGFEKKLLIIGVGYGAKLQGKKLELSLGFSHKVYYEIPELVEVSVEQDPKGNSIINLKSIDKQLVGEVAAKIRDFKKPEPYKGKGIRYFDEVVKIKPGKAAAK